MKFSFKVRSLALASAAALLCVATVDAAPRKPFSVDEMLAMQRISEPDVSPLGKHVAFSVRTTDIAANRGRTDIWVAAVDGSMTRQLTTSPDSDTSPMWSPDGTAVYFLSSRSGSSQVWKIAIAGGEAQQITQLGTDVGGFRVFPDGKRLLLAMDVWPTEPSLAASIKRDEKEAASKVKARTYDQLLFRHWDQWEDGKFSHLFAWTPPELGGKPDSAVDLTPGQMTDSPTHPFGGMEETTITADGKYVAFVARVGGKTMAWTTNTDVFWTSTDGRGKPVNLTADNPAYDFHPTLSPDGKTIALLSMKRAGFEADRQRIRLIDVASQKATWLTEKWDRSPGNFSWSPNSKMLYASADNLGQQSLFSIDATSGAVTMLLEKGHNDSPVVAGDRLLFVRDTLSQPAELFTCALGGNDMRQLTRINDARAAGIAWGEYQQFSFAGAKGETVYGYVVKPPNVAPGKKAPVAMLIHGGPQGSMGDHFHYRWNPQLYAARGFGAVFIDFHGSTGYGQAFTDAISGDWGGAPYEDLMKGLDAALQKFPWLDGKRAAALGASYGGFMVNWINGHTDRFKALVTHAGNLDEKMAYFNTEELWFPEWERGGVPWERSDAFKGKSPVDFVDKWKTPTLVVHGALDFRVVETQGMGTFTALQRRGIPSRFLHFPDENHWILKPQNAQRWHQEVFAWIEKFTK